MWRMVHTCLFLFKNKSRGIKKYKPTRTKKKTVRVSTKIWKMETRWRSGVWGWQRKTWEKAMAPHSSTLAWQIPWLEEPGRLHAVHGVAKSRTRLSNFTLTFHFHALEEEMATHSRILAWRIPWTEEPGGLLSMGSHRVGHD